MGKGQFVYKRGFLGDEMFIIAEGEVRSLFVCCARSGMQPREANKAPGSTLAEPQREGAGCSLCGCYSPAAEMLLWLPESHPRPDWLLCAMPTRLR